MGVYQLFGNCFLAYLSLFLSGPFWRQAFFDHRVALDCFVICLSYWSPRITFYSALRHPLLKL